ncbi:hypothetical protein Pcinc_000022 [Petrolisthes cinctipes]|uniref:Uncharacterized protein n=1 Tax=Petrolisthes cinctipes TaxID=88211 RepID=A0AAE1GN10_PETCI|nr:hypothetical protein Pcinc_000022 [Petrolisthes cinctipes]
MNESEAVHLDKYRKLEDTLQSEMDIPSRLMPQSSSTFMVVDEDKASHLAKSRQLEIKLLEIKIKAEEKRLLAEERRIEAEQKRIEALTARKNYFTQLINDNSSKKYTSTYCFVSLPVTPN